MLITLLIVVILTTFFTLLAVRYLIPFTKGAPYVPTSKDKLLTILSLAKPQPEDTVADLGSGDGRLVVALAHTGATVHGYEINPSLVKHSRNLISQKTLGADRTQIFWQSFWLVDLSRYNLITVYGVPYIMKRLEHKLLQELPSGSRIISNYYTFPTIQPIASRDQVHLYLIPQRDAIN